MTFVTGRELARRTQLLAFRFLTAAPLAPQAASAQSVPST